MYVLDVLFMFQERMVFVLCYVGSVEIVMKFTKFCFAVARVSRMRVSLDIPRGIGTLWHPAIHPTIHIPRPLARTQSQ
jgi:hypothetical protein